MGLRHAETTGQLIDLFFAVYRGLGHGFLERVYSNAMVLEGRRQGLDIKHHWPIQVFYEGSVVGEYEADLIVNDAVIAELKACRTLAPEHEAQLLNYLKATTYEVGILFNFGVKAEFKRFIYDNKLKGNLSWTRKDTEIH